MSPRTEVFEQVESLQQAYDSGTAIDGSGKGDELEACYRLISGLNPMSND